MKLENNKKEEAYNYMIKFLDEKDIDKKMDILCKMEDNNLLDDSIIDNLCASLDIVVDDKNIEDRIMELKNAIKTKAKYESFGLKNRFR